MFLRTGYGRYRHETGHAWTDTAHMTQAGWHASCMPWLHEHDVAYIGADTAQDAEPTGYENIFMPVHTIGIVAMGLWLVDNCDLEACAATAERLQQWDFLMSLGPVRFEGTSGSPAESDRDLLARCTTTSRRGWVTFPAMRAIIAA